MDVKKTATAIFTIKQNIESFKRRQVALREEADGLDAVISFNEESLRTLEK